MITSDYCNADDNMNNDKCNADTIDFDKYNADTIDLIVLRMLMISVITLLSDPEIRY